MNVSVWDRELGVLLKNPFVRKILLSVAQTNSIDALVLKQVPRILWAYEDLRTAFSYVIVALCPSVSVERKHASGKAQRVQSVPPPEESELGRATKRHPRRDEPEDLFDPLQRGAYAGENLSALKMFFQDVDKHRKDRIKVLSPQEERDLFFRLASAQDEATRQEIKNEIVEHNILLVVKIANRFRGHGLESSDLINEGIVGLLRAIDLFDLGRGYKFSTYATWWIRAYITRVMMDTGRAIRIPVHRWEETLRLAKIERGFIQQFGNTPAEEHLSEWTGFSVEKIQELRRVMILEPSSLDAPIGADGDYTTLEFVRDPRSTPEEAIDRSTARKAFEQIKAVLSPREEEVIRRHWEIDVPFSTLEEIGDNFGMTREGVRQIEKKALEKMRKRARALHIDMSGIPQKQTFTPLLRFPKSRRIRKPYQKRKNL